MARSASTTPSTTGEAPLWRRRHHRSQHIIATRAVAESLVSLAGLIHRPVRNQAGDEVGRLVDVVARWSDGQTYPPVTGLVVRVGRREAFVDAASIDTMEWRQVTLRSSRLDLRDFERRPGEVTLARDVLDHQLVDVDGVQVIRAADLYLAPVLGRIRLVGVDVSMSSLVRRLGPARRRSRPTPEQVIDWAAIQPFGDIRSGPAEVRLRTSNHGLNRLRPGELADLLEDLQRPAREELLDALDPEEAADAVEEMDPDEVRNLLRDVDLERAASLLARMEPDEAVDALRDLSPDERDALLGQMPPDVAGALSDLLLYPEDRAGGIMTTLVVAAAEDETVGSVLARLAALTDRRHDIDAVAVVSSDGRLRRDVPVLELAVAGAGTRVGTLGDDDEPVTVTPDAPLAEVAERFIEARRLSIVVVDEDRPVGRILADDVVDALLPAKGRLHRPRWLIQ
jgi:CBS domain-containing protein